MSKVDVLTIEDIQSMKKLTLTPSEVAPILGINPHYIRVQAQNDPSKLGFPVIRTGTRTRIPRIPFLAFMGYEAK